MSGVCGLSVVFARFPLSRPIMRLRSISPLALPVLALGAILSTTACNSTEPAAAAATAAITSDVRTDVSVITVSPADVESTLQLSGTLTPQARVAVKSTLPGTLSRIAVDIGDRVRQGQVLATLDRRELDAQVDAAAAAIGVAKAALESAEAALANAVTERDRAQNLFDKGAVPRQRLDAADTAQRSATAQRELARANLAQAEASHRRAQEVQRDATITSPINGIIVERNFDPGSLVSPGTEQAIVVVADLSTLKLQAGVSELEAGRLRVGMPARVTVQARPGETFDGRVAAIAPEVDARNRHFTVEVRTANPTTSLLSGMYGVAVIPLARAERALAIPRDAIATKDGARVVMKITGDTVAPTTVTEGLSNGALVQITEGLAPGDVILADARREIAAGTKVNPVPVR
jgi:RND family efflux transporter MFP subunit